MWTLTGHFVLPLCSGRGSDMSIIWQSLTQVAWGCGILPPPCCLALPEQCRIHLIRALKFTSAYAQERMGFRTTRPAGAITLSTRAFAPRHVTGKLNSEKGDNWVIFSGWIQQGTYHFLGEKKNLRPPYWQIWELIPSLFLSSFLIIRLWKSWSLSSQILNCIHNTTLGLKKSMPCPLGQCQIAQKHFVLNFFSVICNSPLLVQRGLRHE